MLAELRAESNIKGHSINLTWNWVGPEQDRPALLLLRRTRAHPQYSVNPVQDENLSGNGLTVVDLHQVFGNTDNTWARIQRDMYLGRNTSLESNLQLAEFSQYFLALSQKSTNENLLPERIVIGYYREISHAYTTVELTNITSVNYTELDSTEWSRIQRWEIFHAPDGTNVINAGLVRVSTGHHDSTVPDNFFWHAAGEVPVDVSFDHTEQQNTEALLDESIDNNSGNWNRQVKLTDSALKAEEIYYYRLYLKLADNAYSSLFHWTTEAVSSGDYDFSNLLYQQLPAIHAYYDETEPEKKGTGQLRRYLSLAGASLNLNRSLAEELRNRHDVNQVYSKALPRLANMIGWQSDVTSDAILLRKDIIDAPDIYRTVGTVANLRAVVNRVTGWDCKIKEFVHNVFLTNAVEPIKLWDIWTQYYQPEDSSWSTPQALTFDDTMDGHAQMADVGEANWMFWHSDREGTRSLWRQQINSNNSIPDRLLLRNSVSHKSHIVIDESPVVLDGEDRLWLFWSSNENGQWNIWGSWSRSEFPFSIEPESIDPLFQSQPFMLSEQTGDNRQPAVVRDKEGNLLLFWQSSRRGQTDIWCRVFDEENWNLPLPSVRISTASVRHIEPAVAIDDAGRVWLFYCNDLGDRINIQVMLKIEDNWTLPFEISTGKHRDESPSAIFWQGHIRLFWHSNRNGRWQLFELSLSWSNIKNEPEYVNSQLVITDELTADKEPFVRVDSEERLRLLWRSQRRGRDYQSRSIDTGDAKMLAELRTFQDRAHYTYDTGKNDDDYYARDTVGVFLTPSADRPDLDDRNRRLLNGPLKEFIPITIRPVLFIAPEVYKEYVYTYDIPDIEPQFKREIQEDYSRESSRLTAENYPGLDDSYIDTVEQWTWLRSWSSTNKTHITVDTSTAPPIDTHFRTLHIGINEGA